MTTGPFDRFSGVPSRREGRHTQSRPCDVQASGAIELFFYDELDAAGREAMDRHLAGCGVCRTALGEMGVIRDALAARDAVSAPPSGDWSGFMTRLETAIDRDAATPRVVSFPGPRPGRGVWLPVVAAAALVAVVSGSVMATWYGRGRRAHGPVVAVAPTPVPAAVPAVAADADDLKAALASLSEQHLERSKLVVLGLANKDARQISARDWNYERQLATDLLGDTRMYRLAAEDRGMDDVARVMRDLELVLLQTSMSADSEPATLAQIQRLIQKRDLLGRMAVVNGSGL
jgi:hypothetical protein